MVLVHLITDSFDLNLVFNFAFKIFVDSKLCCCTVDCGLSSVEFSVSMGQ